MITKERPVVGEAGKKKIGRPRLKEGAMRRSKGEFMFWPPEIDAVRALVAREGGSASYAIRRCLHTYLEKHHPDLWERVKDLPR